MTNKLQISGINKSQLFDRAHKALENVTKSPIVKRKNAVVNSFLVDLLHGGHASGQNEHNLDQFFTENSQKTIEDRVYWEVVENICYEDGDYSEDFSVHTGETEELALRAMKVAVIDSLSYDLALILKTEQIVEHLDNDGLKTSELHFMLDRDDTFDSFKEEELESFFEYITNENTKVINSIFDLVFNLHSIAGSFETFEKVEKVLVDKREEPKSVKIHTIIIKYMTGDDFDDTKTINDVEVINTLSEKEHDRKLLEIFDNNLPETEKYLLIENHLFDELNIDEDDAENMEIDELVELYKAHFEPNQLVELVSNLSGEMVEVDVQYQEY